MPPLTITRLKARIGDLGLPRIVWPVFSRHHAEIVLFYDREAADAHVKGDPRLFVGATPLQIKDASHE